MQINVYIRQAHIGGPKYGCSYFIMSLCTLNVGKCTISMISVYIYWSMIMLMSMNRVKVS